MSYTDSLTGETWRFHVNEHDGTITRGRKYQLPDDGGDQWNWYWEGDMMVAFYDEGYPGIRGVHGDEDTHRAIMAYKNATNYDSDPDAALKRLAVRLTGNADADFIVVGLDRGTDLYALSWDGDPDHEWRDEIEALWNGDVWRIEVEENVCLLPGEYEWHPADDIYDEWYGEDKAQAAFEREFPLAEFPAERLIGAES